MTASPLGLYDGLLECSPDRALGASKARCAHLFSRMAEEETFSLCTKGRSLSTSSLPSCDDDTSELASSYCWQGSSSTLKDDDTCCAASGSPLGMLACEDEVLDDDDEDATREWAPGRPSIVPEGPVYHHTEVEEVLRVELGKEAELGPYAPTPVNPEHRHILVQWMSEVCAARALSASTFFAAVSHLDRFLRVTAEAATPPTMLQLLSLTCITVAAKNEQQQCAATILELARDENGCIYQAQDARRMELHLLEVLKWRLRVPSLYSFMSLLLHRVAHWPQHGGVDGVVPHGAEGVFRELAVRVAKLASLDHELTAVPYSTLAAACLLVAETEVKGGCTHEHLKTVQAVQSLVDVRHLSTVVQRLYGLYTAAKEAVQQQQ